MKRTGAMINRVINGSGTGSDPDAAGLFDGMLRIGGPGRRIGH